MMIYVYISPDCQKQAHEHGLEEELIRLQQRVEQEQNWEIYFDTFENPYYVRKKVGYNFRLLIKLEHISIKETEYLVIVFLKIYPRGGKIYNELFINAKKYCTPIYEKQKIITLAPQYLKERLQGNKREYPRLNDKDFDYLKEIRLNLLNLSSVNNFDCYYESAQWFLDKKYQYDDTKLADCYKFIYESFDQQKISDFFIDEKPIFLLMQKELFLLTTHKNNLNIIPHQNYTIPSEFILDKIMWIKSQKTSLPFILNGFQQQVFNYFHTQQYFPLLIDRTENIGKTTCLALLYSQIISKYEECPHDDIIPCLFLCEEHEKLSLQKSIYFYTQLQCERTGIVVNLNQLETSIRESCIDLKTLLLQYINKSGLEHVFNHDTYVNYHRFIYLWNKYIPYATNEQKKINIHEAWDIINFYIKPDNLYCIDEIQDTELIEKLPKEKFDLFKAVEQYIWKKWYKPLCEKKGFWDDRHLIQFVYANQIKIKKYKTLLVDNSQNHAVEMYDYILNHCVWLEKCDIYQAKHIPIIFMSNTKKRFFYEKDWATELLDSLKYIHGFHGVSNDNIFSAKITHTPIQKKNVYLIDSQMFELISAIFSDKTIKIVLNTVQKNKKNFLKQNLVDIFKFTEFDEQYIQLFNLFEHFYTLDNIPIKSTTLALFGFNPDESHLLSNIIQQSVQDIFIFDVKESFNQWVVLYESNKTEYIKYQVIAKITHPTIKVIQDQYQNNLNKIKKQVQYAQAHLDKPSIFNLSLDFARHYDFKSYVELSVLYYSLNLNYIQFFIDFKNPFQQELMIQYLSKHQLFDILFSCIEFFHKNLVIYKIAMKLTFDIRMKISLKEFKEIINYFYLNWNKNSSFLAMVFPNILKKLRSFSEDLYFYDEVGFELYQILQQIKQEQLPLYHVNINDVMAYCLYMAKNFDLSKKLWDEALHVGELEHLPQEYYMITSLSDHIETRITSAISLRQVQSILEIMMNIDLDALQEQCWLKMLEFLQKEDELKPILKQVLPHIHHQDTLDRIYRFCKNNTQENFTQRVQRFKTFQACLNGDWDIVQERFTFYIPTDMAQAREKLMRFAHIITEKKNKKTKNNNTKQKHNEEIVDVLYTLNLNTQLRIIQDHDEFLAYIKDEQIIGIFDLIRKYFTLKQTDNVIWIINFDQIRALCYLLEKSPNLMDMLDIYNTILSRKVNDKHAEFAAQRLYYHIHRIRGLSLDNEDITNKIRKIEVEFKHDLLKVDPNTEIALPILKSKEEIIKSILALTGKENMEIQRLEQEEKNQLLEQQRLEKVQAEQQRLAEEQIKQAKLEQERLAQAKEVQLEQEQLAQAQFEAERLENEKLEHAQLEQALQEKMQQEQASHTELLVQVDLNEPTITPIQEEVMHNEAQQPILEQRGMQERLLQDTIPFESIQPAYQKTQYVNETTPSEPQQPSALGQRWEHELLQPLHHAMVEMQFFNVRIFFSRFHQRLNIEHAQTGERWSILLQTLDIHSDIPYHLVEQRYYLPHLKFWVDIQAEYIEIVQSEYGVNLRLIRK